ncbi:MAG: aminotransferase class I/II-fold pyridoxal phosphate-dependent enzyme [Elusimicrobia bacterium]|nr:aminotransferase class I/II-fold pyridoxal phosphate-dependent enzyme [Elusimicrobiota bacterium]
MRRVPAQGINLFQMIYALLREYEEKTGLEPLNLSLGNPDGVPEEPIRGLKARFAQDAGYDYHTYAEDRNLHRFCEGMVELHAGLRYWEHLHLKAVPIAGIKTATALMALACGLRSRGKGGKFTVVSNLPAYDVIGTWAESYLGAERIVWPLLSSENMRLGLDGLKEALRRRRIDRPDLIFVIRPGNPAAVGCTQGEWRALIEFCLESGARLVNDAAYAGLSLDTSHSALARVAKDYPELEWAELYSVSKSFNDPGARLGALVGSRDFVEDFVVIKGNTDSGPVPSAMAAYGTFFGDLPEAARSLRRLSELYRRRLDYLEPRIAGAGFRRACSTEAGFFTLWKAPREVLGVDLAKDPGTSVWAPHEAFNRLVISKTGIAGVHFMTPEAEPLIRYAVCADVLSPVFRERFEAGLARLKPRY